MTLSLFKPKNHPQQQIARRGPLDDVDTRLTPRKDWNAWNEEFGPFTLDVAASAVNTKCTNFFTIEQDGLRESWSGVVWCNPPFSDCAAWVRKAMQEVFHGDCARVVMLLPANRTEQGWWQNYIEPIRDRGKGVATRNIRGRINFGIEGDNTTKYKSSPPFGCVLVIFDKIAENKNARQKSPCGSFGLALSFCYHTKDLVPTIDPNIAYSKSIRVKKTAETSR